MAGENPCALRQQGKLLRLLLRELLAFDQVLHRALVWLQLPLADLRHRLDTGGVLLQIAGERAEDQRIRLRAVLQRFEKSAGFPNGKQLRPVAQDLHLLFHIGRRKQS